MKEVTKKSKRGLCKICNKKFFKISQNNLCVNCSTEKVEIARLQIKHKQGPIYDKWKLKMKQSLGVEE